jgi:hypothetical protein
MDAAKRMANAIVPVYIESYRTRWTTIAMGGLAFGRIDELHRA